MKQILLFILGIPSRVYNYVMLIRKHVSYGNNLVINGRIHIHGMGKIRIGDNVTINSNQNSNPTAGGSATHLFTGSIGELIIGNNSGISNAAITAWECITIGNHVLIGSNCMITDTDFHSLDAEERQISDGRGIKCSPVTIEDHVFIGARSIILKDVTIGKNSIVGAGSVVTRDIPPNEIWAGNPAKFIKRITELEL